MHDLWSLWQFLKGVGGVSYASKWSLNAYIVHSVWITSDVLFLKNVNFSTKTLAITEKTPRNKFLISLFDSADVISPVVLWFHSTEARWSVNVSICGATHRETRAALPVEVLRGQDRTTPAEAGMQTCRSQLEGSWAKGLFFFFNRLSPAGCSG